MYAVFERKVRESHTYITSTYSLASPTLQVHTHSHIMHQSTQSKELGQFEHRYEAANSTPINAEVLERLLCSRRDLARLTDHKSFAHLKLSANTLVRDPEDVEYFLRTLGMYCSRNINLSMYFFMFQISSHKKIRSLIPRENHSQVQS